jgi:hypothetical protein
MAAHGSLSGDAQPGDAEIRIAGLYGRKGEVNSKCHVLAVSDGCIFDQS